MKKFVSLLLLCVCVAGGFSARAAEPGSRTEVIYGRKFGTALTLDVLRPEHTNGFGVLAIISGGFFSSHEAINPGFLKELLERGYTVFAVVHGSQPKFTIPEIQEDVHRASRWVHFHSAEYGVVPNKLGVIGSSAGGQLSLVLGTQGKAGDPAAKDPVDRESSAVGAVACFFPPTDFENWGEPGDVQVGIGKVGTQFKAAFGPRSDDAESRKKLGHEISPLNFVTASMAPTLILHGDADKLVPIYQAEIFLKKTTEVGATCKVVRKEGMDHGWAGMDRDLVQFADWFDHYLRGMPLK
ncbi:MAG TPA: alpha/beta hydrolase [Candidatus Limnocylindria bacterium]|nr:alpha/beta hydrolase [Candidatus Limnocylindria bacterium]